METEKNKNNIKIKSLDFNQKIGESLNIPLKNIIVLVGANNSGKSLALREIEAYCNHSDPKVPLNNQIIKDITFANLPSSSETLQKVLSPFMKPRYYYDEQNNRTQYISRWSRESYTLYDSDISAFDDPQMSDEKKKDIFRKVLGLFIKNFIAGDRFQLAQPKPTTERKNKELLNEFTSILYDKTHKNRIRLDAIIHKMFDSYVCFESENSKIALRLSTQQIDYEQETQLSPTLETEEIYNNSLLISSLGDGVKCVTGLIIGMLSSFDQRIILIDEPEAFCSPPIARQLAQELSKIAIENDISLIVATHSAPFILGCLDVVQEETSIVRLTYDKNTKKATTCLLPSEEIQDIAKNPILKHSYVIQSMFHPAVILTDSDVTRIIYEEISLKNKLTTESKDSQNSDKENKTNQIKSINGLHILSKKGVNSLLSLVEPLRSLGIKTAVIVRHTFFKNKSDFEKSSEILSDVFHVKKETINEIYAMFDNHINNQTELANKLKEYGIFFLTEQKKEIKEDILADILNDKEPEIYQNMENIFNKAIEYIQED